MLGKCLVFSSYVSYILDCCKRTDQDGGFFCLTYRYAVFYKLITIESPSVNDTEGIPFSESKEIFLAESFATLLHRRQVRSSTNTSGSPAKDVPRQWLNHSDRPIRSIPLYHCILVSVLGLRSSFQKKKRGTNLIAFFFFFSLLFAFCFISLFFTLFTSKQPPTFRSRPQVSRPDYC